MADNRFGDGPMAQIRRVDDPNPYAQYLGEPKCESSTSNSLMTELETQSASGLDEGDTATYVLLLERVAYWVDFEVVHERLNTENHKCDVTISKTPSGFSLGDV